MGTGTERKRLPSGKESVEPIRLGGGGRLRGFGVLLVCFALLTAGFGVAAIWEKEDWRDLPSERSESETETPPDPPAEAEAPSYDGVRIVSRSFPAAQGLENLTALRPDEEAFSTAFKLPLGGTGDEETPVVLIYHSHTGECYAEEGTEMLSAPLGDAIYSRDAERNVLAVGEALCRALNERGISAIHCTEIFDDPTVGGAFLRASEVVRQYLEIYPSIRLCIDLHRDSILDAEGNCVRSIAERDGETLAQVSCVVGSSGSGVPFAGWEGNLALALRLRDLLNADGGTLCRSVTLRNETFGQEVCPAALILGIGTGGNTVSEAERTAAALGDALASLLTEDRSGQ